MLFKPSYPVRAKVRIGEKKQAQSGRGFPSSVDYFLSTDPLLAQLYGAKPQSIRIEFPSSDTEDNFSTGLEWWVKGKKSNTNVLACYTKDGEKALRMGAMLLDGEKPTGPALDSGRVPVACLFRECPIFKRGDCKPMGRLVFWLVGAPKDSVWELDTKSWNSIEGLTAAFNAAGDPRGRTFDLSVSFETKGANRFPVLSLTEVDVQVNTPEDAAKADALFTLDATLSAEGLEDRTGSIRAALASALDHTNPGWRDRPDFVARIKEVGVEAAAKGLLSRALA